MKNKLCDLNDHLFASLERLNDEDLNQEQVTKEIGRSRAISGVAKEIISNARLCLDAEVELGKHIKEGDYAIPALLKQQAS